MENLNGAGVTSRESRVFEMLVGAQPAADIAVQLGIELQEVKSIREQLVDNFRVLNEAFLSYIANQAQ